MDAVRQQRSNGRHVDAAARRSRSSGGSGALDGMYTVQDSGETHQTIGSQIFCLLVATFINAHMTSTQKKWDVGPSGLVVFTCP